MNYIELTNSCIIEIQDTPINIADTSNNKVMLRERENVSIQITFC